MEIGEEGEYSHTSKERKENEKSITEFFKEHKVKSSKDIEELFKMDEKLKKRNNFVDALLEYFGPARVHPYFGGISHDLLEAVGSIVGSMMLKNKKTRGASVDFLCGKPSSYNLIWDHLDVQQYECRLKDGILCFKGEYFDPHNLRNQTDSWKIYVRSEGPEVNIKPPKLTENSGDFENVLYNIDQYFEEIGLGQRGSVIHSKYKEAMSEFD